MTVLSSEAHALLQKAKRHTHTTDSHRRRAMQRLRYRLLAAVAAGAGMAATPTAAWCSAPLVKAAIGGAVVLGTLTTVTVVRQQPVSFARWQRAGASAERPSQRAEASTTRVPRTAPNDLPTAPKLGSVSTHPVAAQDDPVMRERELRGSSNAATARTAASSGSVPKTMPARKLASSRKRPNETDSRIMRKPKPASVLAPSALRSRELDGGMLDMMQDDVITAADAKRVVARSKRPVSSPSRGSRVVPSLGRQLTYIRQAEFALRKRQYRKVLRLVADYVKRYPGDVFAIEAAALRAQALCASAAPAAKQCANTFKTRWPDSPLLHRVLESCDSQAGQPR